MAARTLRTGPARLLAGVVAVAAAALLLVACGGGGGGGDGDAVGGSEITFVGTDGGGGMAFDPATATAEAGEITIELDNQGQLRHTLVIEGMEDQLKLDAPGGGSDSGTVQLEPGTYAVYCDVAGHRDAGMEATLTVE